MINQDDTLMTELRILSESDYEDGWNKQLAKDRMAKLNNSKESIIMCYKSGEGRLCTYTCHLYSQCWKQ